MADFRDRAVIQQARDDAETLIRNPDLSTYELAVVRSIANALDRLDAILARRAANGNPIPDQPGPP